MKRNEKSPTVIDAKRVSMKGKKSKNEEMKQQNHHNGLEMEIIFFAFLACKMVLALETNNNNDTTPFFKDVDRER